MSAFTGALGIGLALVVEDVIVSNKGGAGAVSGAFGLIARGIQRFGDPARALIPDLADQKKPAPTQPSGPPGSPGGGIGYFAHQPGNPEPFPHPGR